MQLRRSPTSKRLKKMTSTTPRRWCSATQPVGLPGSTRSTKKAGARSCFRMTNRLGPQTSRLNRIVAARTHLNGTAFPRLTKTAPLISCIPSTRCEVRTCWTSSLQTCRKIQITAASTWRTSTPSTSSISHVTTLSWSASCSSDLRIRVSSSSRANGRDYLGWLAGIRTLF